MVDARGECFLEGGSFSTRKMFRKREEGVVSTSVVRRSSCSALH